MVLNRSLYERYAGLYNLVDMENIVVLNAERVSRIEAGLPGLRRAFRVKISKIKDPQSYSGSRTDEEVRDRRLVISGGDDTGAWWWTRLQGIPVCMRRRPWTSTSAIRVGGDSAVNRIAVMVVTLDYRVKP